MKWTVFRQCLNESHKGREEYILSAIRDGSFCPIRWAVISSEMGSYVGILYVATDALQIGEPGDNCRVNFTHRGAQQAVDILGLALPTDKIADLIHQQATYIIEPHTDAYCMSSGKGAYTSTMEKHSHKVGMSIGLHVGLVSTVGKHWITHDRLKSKKNWAVNYGWHSDSAPYKSRMGQRLWQTVGTRHSWDHVDYSQVLVPVNRIMLVNGEEMLLEEVMVHPELSKLVSYDGPMKVTRHPDVPEPSGGVKVLRI